MPQHLVCITLDFDTVSLWQAMGQVSPTPISRGEFGVVAAQRLLDLFARRQIPTTWFVPGITIDSFEPICRAAGNLAQRRVRRRSGSRIPVLIERRVG